MSTISCADMFANVAHAAVGQLRKYTLTPYIDHPREVYALVRSVPHTTEMGAAALLHDVVEDTKVPLVMITLTFGKEVSDLVEMLTDVSKPEDGNRKARKAIDLAHTALASNAAKTIKLADLISNTKSIVDNDPSFAKIYLKEKEALMEVLIGGDVVLYAEAMRLLVEGKHKLKLVREAQ